MGSSKYNKQKYPPQCEAKRDLPTLYKNPDQDTASQGFHPSQPKAQGNHQAFQDLQNTLRVEGTQISGTITFQRIGAYSAVFKSLYVLSYCKELLSGHMQVSPPALQQRNSVNNPGAASTVRMPLSADAEISSETRILRM